MARAAWWRSATALTMERPSPCPWTVVIPTVAWAGGLTATVVIGALAGLLPALRAARMSPTEALWIS
jgi:ABC-type antimicrobial peptide transport system permease subunit